ncbi:MAG: AI-2E family transporter [Patescibacteria group bacterium]
MKTQTQKVQFDISPMLILKILGVILALVFIYLVRDVILVLFVSLIIASAITPWVDSLQEKKIPRVISVLVIYLFLFGLFTGIFMLIIPPTTTQLGQLANNLPHYYNEASKWLANADSSSQVVIGLQGVLQKLTESLTNGASGVFALLGSFLGTMFKAFLVLVITFYITLQKDSVKKFVQLITPDKYQPYAIQLTRRIQEKMGAWVIGQLVLGLIIGTMCYVALTIMGVKYALILGIFAGITELIPFIGPLIGMVPAVFLAFLQAPILGLIVFIVYIFIQQLENNLIVPLVMKKAVGLNPIITIVAITIGSNLAGIAGAIIAIPLTAVISILAKDAMQLGQDIEKI